MNLQKESPLSTEDISAFFGDVFEASEGSDEGQLIAGFVHSLLLRTPERDIRLFTARDEGRLIGAICLSRMTYPDDPRDVFMLSPVAVATEAQGQGIGKRLITTGLDALKDEGISYAITYGDPAYYARCGFAQITEDFAKAPLALSQPQGWLGQPLGQTGNSPFKGTPTCVKALNNTALW